MQVDGFPPKEVVKTVFVEHDIQGDLGELNLVDYVQVRISALDSWPLPAEPVILLSSTLKLYLVPYYFQQPVDFSAEASWLCIAGPLPGQRAR